MNESVHESIGSLNGKILHIYKLLPHSMHELAVSVINRKNKKFSLWFSRSSMTARKQSSLYLYT